MQVRKSLSPFLLSFGGVLSDYLTTSFGLSLGFRETHPLYHPLNALLLFWGATTLLTLLLPKGKFWTISINAVALSAYVGTINNILVILSNTGKIIGLNT
jgi:hypothetical protein